MLRVTDWPDWLTWDYGERHAALADLPDPAAVVDFEVPGYREVVGERFVVVRHLQEVADSGGESGYYEAHPDDEPQDCRVYVWIHAEEAPDDVS